MNLIGAQVTVLSSSDPSMVGKSGRVVLETARTLLLDSDRREVTLVKAGTLKQSPIKQLVAATSVGIVEGTALLDLCYEEDSQAEVDMNVVMTADGGLVETQATAEKGSFSRAQLNSMIDLAEAGLKDIFAAQRAVLGI